jgi:hypothetical protein
VSAAAVAARAEAAGLTLAAYGTRLRWRGPQPSPELLAELRAHKTELLLLLDARPAVPAATPPPATPAQAAEEKSDRAAIAAEGAPPATAPVARGVLAAWEAELALLLSAAPGQRIVNPEKAGPYFAAEARRRLAAVQHDQQAAGLLMGFWRHARGRAS